MMNVKFDFIIHWLWTIIWSLLALSGFSMVSPKYGWILNFDYGTADYIHRIASAAFVILTLISIFDEIIRNFKKDPKKQAWFIFGNSGFKLFVFITTLIMIITGALIWICTEFEMKTVGFTLVIHEYIAFLTLASVIWHIYKKGHALMWPKKVEQTQPKGIRRDKNAAKTMV